MPSQEGRQLASARLVTPHAHTPPSRHPPPPARSRYLGSHLTPSFDLQSGLGHSRGCRGCGFPAGANRSAQNKGGSRRQPAALWRRGALGESRAGRVLDEPSADPLGSRMYPPTTPRERPGSANSHVGDRGEGRGWESLGSERWAGLPREGQGTQPHCWGPADRVKEGGPGVGVRVQAGGRRGGSERGLRKRPSPFGAPRWPFLWRCGRF